MNQIKAIVAAGSSLTAGMSIGAAIYSKNSIIDITQAVIFIAYAIFILSLISDKEPEEIEEHKQPK